MRNIINTIFFTELLKGLGFTFKNIFAPKVTTLYPYEAIELPKRARGIHYMKERAPGVTACTACTACSRACPADCIAMTKGKGPDGKGSMATEYAIDLSKCIFCGYCEDVCPFDAIHMGHSPHLATSGSREDMSATLPYLTENYKTYLQEEKDNTYATSYGLVNQFKDKKQVQMPVSGDKA